MSLDSIMMPVVVIAITLSIVLTYALRALAFRLRIVDEPVGGRKVHGKRTALLGGIATGLTIIVILIALLPFADGMEVRQNQIIGFVIAIIILMIGGYIDDRYSIRPWQQFLFPLAASLAIVFTGSGIVQVTNPFGSGAISLIWYKIVTPFLTISLPSDLLTIFWLLVVTYAMKFLDGLDELVAGLTVVSGVLIASLAASDAYFQPLIALFALVVAGAHLGFLPFNRSGSIFLGEAGSTIAGFSLGVLAVISGAKLATAATALAVPLVDIVLVIAGRVLAGRSPFRGDSSHLHFRLLQAGLTQRTAVRLIWMLALVFGLLALTFQTKGKLFLFAGLVMLILVIAVVAYQRAQGKANRT